MSNDETIGWSLKNSYMKLPQTFYEETHPEPALHPHLVAFNETLAQSLGLDAQQLKESEGIAVLSGSRIPEKSQSIAQAYAGHQFGHFTMLGDGRAVLLGEQITPAGERFDIQLKGAGRTTFSRGGDGRAALGPMLREYIISEAMHALGIPTTRGLAVVKTGLPVHRERPLQGAVLIRVAASHIRVGTFQYAAAREASDELKKLADYVIDRHYPEVKDAENPYHELFRHVIDRQASLVAKWQLVGFIHGVMNTDNMTISGETIDYGPCAFMDTYDPKTVFSSIDQQGRYAYQNQPGIAEWNLARFAETLLPLFHDDTERAVDIAQDLLATFASRFHRYWMKGMRNKLGLSNERQEDRDLIKDLLQLMEHHQADFTNTFRSLTLESFTDEALFEAEDFAHWRKRLEERRAQQSESIKTVRELMRQHNPAVIPRNHRVEEALAAAEQEEWAPFHQLMQTLKKPYAYSDDQKAYICPSSSTVPYRTFCGT
ncbi:YdiU family protein [Bacillaceae bacterium SIJ1]|uniref:protein adenylyltransferase SelO n=1 Tax=Litoribacterium kuwaitense TaxID=1398745 RepID=UPI0013ED103D|nr:YdiU family protein [Litoribacterium kuwaitense]NGP45620.1 YdiU family protein [Litoribacterium kuwaitense]